METLQSLTMPTGASTAKKSIKMDTSSFDIQPEGGVSHFTGASGSTQLVSSSELEFQQITNATLALLVDKILTVGEVAV